MCVSADANSKCVNMTWVAWLICTHLTCSCLVSCRHVWPISFGSLLLLLLKHFSVVCGWLRPLSTAHRIPERQLIDQEGCVNLPLPFAFVSFWCQTKMQFVAAFMIDFIFVLVYLWIDLLNNINRCSSIDDEITAYNLHSFFQICNPQNLLHAAVLWGTAVF